MSGMKQLNQRGSLNPLLIPLILVILLLIGAGSFAAWAFMSRQDYKNNTDQKVSAAVTVAEQQTSSKKDNEFLEKEKLPLRTYNGPTTFGSLSLQYPKTWSVYADEQVSGATPLDVYFQPNFVPAINSTNATYALRVQVTSTSYASVLKGYETTVTSGKLKASAYVPAKVPSVTGTRLDGEVSPNKQGAMVIMPLRDKTLKIWTESNDFLNDFNNNILPNYSFEP